MVALSLKSPPPSDVTSTRAIAKGFPTPEKTANLASVSKPSNKKEIDEARGALSKGNARDVSEKLIFDLTKADRPPLNALSRETRIFSDSLSQFLGISPHDIHLDFQPGKIVARLLNMPITLEFEHNVANVKISSSGTPVAVMPFRLLGAHLKNLGALLKSEAVVPGDLILGASRLNDDSTFFVQTAPQGRFNQRQYFVPSVTDGKLTSITPAFGAQVHDGTKSFAMAGSDIVIDAK